MPPLPWWEVPGTVCALAPARPCSPSPPGLLNSPLSMGTLVSCPATPPTRASQPRIRPPRLQLRCRVPMLGEGQASIWCMKPNSPGDWSSCPHSWEGLLLGPGALPWGLPVRPVPGLFPRHCLLLLELLKAPASGSCQAGGSGAKGQPGRGLSGQTGARQKAGDCCDMVLPSQLCQCPSGLTPCCTSLGLSPEQAAALCRASATRSPSIPLPPADKLRPAWPP